jgi:TRAP-type uncharacterized transport system substrate-binding protein
VAAAPARAAVPQKPALQAAAAGAVAATAAAAGTAAAAAQPLKPFSILADPGDLIAARMARDFTSVLGDNGASGRAIVGSTSPTGLAKVAHSSMADFAIIPLDTAIVAAKDDPKWAERDPVVSPLAPETLEVIAPADVKTLADLEGRSVSFGDPDSATANSARLLFSRLGVNVSPAYEPLTEGLNGLAAGRRGAIIVMGAKEANALDGFGAGGKFHIVSIPWSDAFADVYAPARVPAADRPNLIAANDTVETVAEPMAMVAIDAAPGSARAEAIGRVAQIFVTSYDSFLTDGRDPHWQDVNLAAETALLDNSWPRIASVQGWLDDHKKTADASLDAFRETAKTAAAAAGGPKAEDSDRLYDNLTRWRSLMQ